MAEWSEWLQDVGKSVINKATDNAYVQPYEIDKMRLQALGDLGIYTEGRAGTTPVQQQQALTLSPTMLMMGLGLLAVMMMTSD